MTPATYTNLNKLLLIRDIPDIAKTYINDDRSYRWIWKNKIADVYHISYVTFMNYNSTVNILLKTCVNGLFLKWKIVTALIIIIL